MGRRSSSRKKTIASDGNGFHTSNSFNSFNTNTNTTIVGGGQGQGTMVVAKKKKRISNLLLLGGGGGGTGDQKQQQQQQQQQQKKHDQQQKRHRRPKPPPPLSPPVLQQALRGVGIFVGGGSRRNMFKRPSDGGAAASARLRSVLPAGAGARATDTTKKDATNMTTTPPVLVVQFPEDDVGDVGDVKQKKKDVGRNDADETNVGNAKVKVEVDVSMTSTINTSTSIIADDDEDEDEDDDEDDDGDHEEEVVLPGWTAVFDDGDDGDGAGGIDTVFEEMDDYDRFGRHGHVDAADLALVARDRGSSSSDDFPQDEQRRPSHERRQNVHMDLGHHRHTVGSGGTTTTVVVVREERTADEEEEEVEIEFYYCNEDPADDLVAEGDEQPSDCQQYDDDGDEFFFLPLAENNPFFFKDSSTSNKQQTRFPPPTFVPSTSGVTDFDDDAFACHTTVGPPAVVAPVGAITATPSSAAAASGEEFFSNGYGSPLNLSIDENDEYGLFGGSSSDDHHLSFLAEAATTELRMLQQPRLDLDDKEDEDNDDDLDDEEQDHQQLLRDLQREVIISEEEPVTATTSTVSADDSALPNQSTAADQESRPHVVVRMTSSYESFDAVKVKVVDDTETGGRRHDDDEKKGSEEVDGHDEEKYNLHRVYASSENLIELEENVPTPIRGSQRKNRTTSVLEELGLAPTTSTATTASSTERTSSMSSSSSSSNTRPERTNATKTTDTADNDKTSQTKSLTLCIDQYGPATFYKLLNDLKDNKNITELYVFRSWYSSNGCKRSTNDIVQLFDVILSIKFLKVLKISNFSGPELDDAVRDTQWCHPTVSKLQLHIRQGAISEQTLEQLAGMTVLDELVMEMNESFPFHFALSSKSLTKLTVVANYFDLDNMHLMETIDAVRENRVLRSLAIEPPMKLRAFKLLAYSLRSNTTLEELTVSLIPSRVDNDSVGGDDVEGPSHISMGGFDDETSAAIEVANLLRTNSTLQCLKNKNSAFIKVGPKGASDVLDALVGSNVVVDFALFDEKEHRGFTKSKDAKLNRNKAVSEISFFKNFFSCSSIDLNVDLPKVDLPNVEFPKVDLPNVDLPKMISTASATASTTATVCEEVASESKVVLESVYQDYKDIGNSLQEYKGIGSTIVGDGMKAITGISSVVDTMFKQFAF